MIRYFKIEKHTSHVYHVSQQSKMLGSNCFSETFEVRGSPRIEKHFRELEEILRAFAFEVQTGISASLALEKYPDGSWIVPPQPMLPPITDSGFSR